MHITIVEDDKRIAEDLKKLLENALYEVTVIDDFNNTVDEITKLNPDLILLDITLPGINGQQVCQRLRHITDTPIIFLTADNRVLTELNSILIGGDDFISKPYEPAILLARISAVLKRVKKLVTEVLVYKEISLDIQTYMVAYASKRIELSKNEFKLLYYFFQHQGSVVSRNELIEYLWDNQIYIDDNALSVNITRVRAKLAEIDVVDFIQTIRGQGYKI